MVKSKKSVKHSDPKLKKAHKLIGQIVGAGYVIAEAIPAKDAYDQATGDMKTKAWAVLKAKGGVVGKEFGLATDEFRWDVLVNQHKLAVGMAIVDYGSDKLGVQKRLAKAIKRFM